MRFHDIITGLEQTCIEMHQAARAAQWNSVADLDRRRVHLLDAMSAPEDHHLTPSLRKKIERILSLDRQILEMIRQGRAQAEREAAKQRRHRHNGAAMYAEIG